MGESNPPISVHWDGSESICTTIAFAVAIANDVDPLDLDTTLYDVIDPEALEKLIRRTRADSTQTLRLRFTFEGCDVVVSGDRTIGISPPDPQPNASKRD